jgi:uncharacterized protein (DUF1800 family)
MTQKLVRAVYSQNQAREVLTDFWINHFHVSLEDNQARAFLTTYERDAIRPHILGGFRELLEATAKHPAMLLYLDNAQSTANDGVATTFDRALVSRRASDAWLGFGSRGRRRSMDEVGGGAGGARPGVSRFAGPGMAAAGLPSDGGLASSARQRRPRPTGLNENYARELLELHTLGVDGGYSQEDVVQVARALSGWTLYPPRARQEGTEDRLRRALSANAGFVVDGDFLFRADAHDAAAKTVLGVPLAAGRGLEDGEQVLDLLAAHPATARHLARKFATRFVSDEPPATLVERLTQVFLSSGGNLELLTVALVQSPEFWAPAARRQKIKSPFELVASSLRALDAELYDPRELLEWLARLGQIPYGYQAPTGFPDRAEHWVNTGSLLNRMNFGLQLAASRVAGVEFDIASWSPGAEPESPAAALVAYAARLLPERDLAELVRQMESVVSDPGLATKVIEAMPEAVAETMAMADRESRRGNRAERGLPDSMDGMGGMADSEFAGEGGPLFRRRAPRVEDRTPPTPLQQVVGVILGSPEFQRR